MLLTDLLDMLTDGELAQLSIGGSESGTIEASDYRKVVNFINRASKAIHTRFPLLLKQTFIQQYDHISTYYLNIRYAQSNTASTETYKYIVDYSTEPFMGNVLKIDQVYDEDGQEVPLNDTSYTYSVFTPSFNSIQVPYPNSDNALNVIYRSCPDTISKSVSDISNTEIDIPDSVLEPFLTYINYLAYLHFNNGQEANNLLNKYSAQCLELDRVGMIQTDFTTNVKLWRDGWV